MVILSADDWVCIFVVCCLDPGQDATGGWVMLGLVFPLYEFSLFDTP